MVWKLDRLARSLKEGVNVLADWCQRGVRVIATTQQIDLSGPVGNLIAGGSSASQKSNCSTAKNVRRLGSRWPSNVAYTAETSRRHQSCAGASAKLEKARTNGGGDCAGARRQRAYDLQLSEQWPLIVQARVR